MAPVHEEVADGAGHEHRLQRLDGLRQKVRELRGACFGLSDKICEERLITGVAARNHVTTKAPLIARLDDRNIRRGQRLSALDLNGGCSGLIDSERHVDLGRFEAGQAEVVAEFDEGREFGTELLVVPFCVLWQTV